MQPVEASGFKRISHIVRFSSIRQFVMIVAKEANEVYKNHWRGRDTRDSWKFADDLSTYQTAGSKSLQPEEVQLCWQQYDASIEPQS
jgi:hypothetical protein